MEKSKRSFLVELVTGVIEPDYLLEDAKEYLETILTLKNNESKKQVLDNFTRRLQMIRETLRKEFIGTPWPQKADDFLTGHYAWIDRVYRWFITGLKAGKANWETYRELRNEMDGLFNRQIVFERARADNAREKIKQFTQELNDEQTNGEREKGTGTKKPSEEAKTAYKLYGVLSNQTEVANKMNQQLNRTDFTQSKVSRLIKQYKKWLKDTGLPDVNEKPKIKVERVSADFVEMGKRTDSSRAKGSQLNKHR